jgi:glycosyltransferase involved in cell wall biosynthesis
MEQATPATRPLISVVTPFYNTAPYLAQCIESVLSQSYTQFEYILVDNCSTDGSSEIAETYARRDPRIRLIRRLQLVPQLRNYNDALKEISDDSQYCKIVQADDYIFPQCLELMIQAFEQSESVGLVSSYCLEGNVLRGSGYPYWQPLLSGKECARLYLRSRVAVFGTQTTVMYRSSVVRYYRPFYDESLPNADFDRCMQILQRWDFGFVHQVLSFSRRDNESLTSGILSFMPYEMDRYIFVQRYAAAFLEAGEAASLRRKSKVVYYRLLANEALHFRESAFWRYHESGLKTLDETIDWSYLVLQMVVELFWIVLNPGWSMVRALRFWKSKSRRRQCDNLREKEMPLRYPRCEG